MKEASPSTKPCVLVAPLDWGLGHTTRCIPIIHQLCTAGCRVIMAGSEISEVILRSEFPNLLFLRLPGYRIHYTISRAAMYFSLAAQLPKMYRAIRYEHEWLKEVVREYKIDAVISDNRYGLYHASVHSIFMTHQLQINTGMGRTADALLRRLHYRLIRNFNASWVPDAEEEPNLSGRLSHPGRLPGRPVAYLGPLSRFCAEKEQLLPHYLLVLLSGPEPQRSLLEKKLLQQAKEIRNPVLFVRGLPGQISVPAVPYHINIVNHLPTQTLQKAIGSAAFVLARTGYSSVMELMLLQKKCILIPTPGQTEQEYLARHLMQTQQALCLPQHKLRLSRALELAESFPYRLYDYENGACLRQAIDQLMADVAHHSVYRSGSNRVKS